MKMLAKDIAWIGIAPETIPAAVRIEGRETVLLTVAEGEVT